MCVCVLRGERSRSRSGFIGGGCCWLVLFLEADF